MNVSQCHPPRIHPDKGRAILLFKRTRKRLKRCRIGIVKRHRIDAPVIQELVVHPDSLSDSFIVLELRAVIDTPHILDNDLKLGAGCRNIELEGLGIPAFNRP